MKPIFNPFLCCVFTLCTVFPSRAASLSWDGTSTGTGAQGGAGTWDSNTTANWWNGSANVAWPNTGSDNDAVFGGTASNAVLVSGTVTVNDISIATGYKVGADSSGTILLNGATPTITTTGSSSFASIGAIIDGSAGLTKTGNITLELRGANIYTGDTRVLNGTLLIGGASNRLPTATTLILGDSVTNTSGVFQMNQRSQEVAGLQSVGTGTGNRVINGSTTASTFTVSNTTDQTFGGILGGTGTNHNNFAFTKSGAATLVLTNTNTYTGTTAIRNGSIALIGGDDRLLTTGTVVLGDVSTSGKLILGDSTTARNQTLAGLTVTGSGGSVVGAAAANSVLTISNASGTNTFAGKLGGLGMNENNLALIKSGAGTLLLSGDNSFTGDVTVNAGRLSLTHSNALGTGTKNFFMQGTSRILDISNNITLGDSITLNASTNSGDGTGIVSSGGTNEIKGKINITTGNGVLNISSAAGTLTASGNITATTTGRSLILGGASATENTVSGIISDGSTVNMPVTKQGAGNWVFTNANTYSGDTKITGGTLTLGNNLAIQNSAFDTSGAGTMVLSGTATPTFGGLKGSTGLATAISSGYGSVTDLTLNPGSGASHVYSGAITNGSGNTTLTKNGAGTQILSGNNSYTGATNVSAGKLLINGNNSAATGTVTVASGATLGGTGTVGGATSISGTHNAGDAATNAGVGSQAFASNLTYADGSIFEWDLNASSTSTGFDTVSSAGTIGVGTTDSVFKVIFGTTAIAGVQSTSNAFWNTPYGTQTWNMIDIFGQAFSSGAFQSVQTSNDVSTYGSFTINGSTLTWTAVPEPTSALAGILLTFGLLRRRRG